MEETLQQKVEGMVVWVNEAALNAGVVIKQAGMEDGTIDGKPSQLFVARVIFQCKSSQAAGAVVMSSEEVRRMFGYTSLTGRWRAMMRDAWKNVEGPPDPNAGEKR